MEQEAKSAPEEIEDRIARRKFKAVAYQWERDNKEILALLGEVVVLLRGEDEQLHKAALETFNRYADNGKVFAYPEGECQMIACVDPKALKNPNRHKQAPTSPAAIEQVATRFQARSNSDTEMEALLRLLIYKHYDNSKRSRAAKIRETSLTFLTAFCRRRTRLYTSVRAGLETQYNVLEGVNYKQGFLLEILREVAIQIDSVNSTEELENLPKAVQKPIARKARRCLREYTNEKRLSLPDSDMNAIETLIADPKNDVRAFVNREAELSEFKALIDTGKLKGQKRELALILCKHPDLAGYGGNVEIARILGWKPAHVRQIKRRLKIAANS